MDTVTYPTEGDLRRALMERADRYCDGSGVSRGTLGKMLKNDTSLFHDIASGKRNFTVGTYSELMDWFEKNPPEAKQGRTASRQRSARTAASAP